MVKNRQAFLDFMQKKLNKPLVYSATGEIAVKKEIQEILKEEKEEKEEAESAEKIVLKSQNTDKPLDRKRTIQLRIKLNSWSPVYKQMGVSYREKIALDAFEKDLPVSKQELFSYVDHEISIEKMIGSTKNNSMLVTKEAEDSIVADIQIDEKDAIARKTADLIEAGVITSNSFIFAAQDVEYNWIEEEQKKDDIDLEIVYKKGQLISIDPVYKGFFPQCETSIEYKEELIKEDNSMSENIIKEELVEKKDEIIAEKISNPNAIEIEDIVNKRIESNIGLIKKALAKNETSKNITFEEVRSKWLNRKHLTAEENAVLYKDLIDLKNDAEERKDTTFLKSIDFTNANGNNIFSTYGLVQKALDGTTKENGLALIETLTSKNIISEWMSVFPELTEYATILPIIGLNKIQQPVLIPDKTAVSKIAEGAASTKQGGKTTNVLFEPDRYSVELDQNNQLNSFSSTLDKQTMTIKDNIREALRKNFYVNLFKNVGANLNTSTYDGGATQEAVRTTATVNSLKLSDLDAVANELYAKWGDNATNGYIIAMHVDVLQVLENEYFTAGNSLWKDIYNPVTRTFRGMKIIPLKIDGIDKTIATGKNVVAFFLKSAVVAYGCSFVTQDSNYEKMSEDLFARFVRLRGQIKMCDPYLNTRVIKVK